MSITHRIDEMTPIAKATQTAHKFNVEFGSDVTMPREILGLIESGELLDTSWHNDISPSFMHRDAECESGDFDLRLWIHPEKAEDRERPDMPRFGVCEHMHQDAYALETNDVNEAIAHLRIEAATIAKARRGY